MNKKLLIGFLLFFGAALLALPACKKKQEVIPQTELEKLPAATQIGANTFGALVNGQAFLPYTDALFASTYQCNYIYLNGGYNFYLNASSDIDNYITAVSLSTTSSSISEGQTLKLENHYENGKAAGLYEIFTGGTKITYETTTIVDGLLHINKFDQTKQIVSGTFSFKAIKLTTNDTVHVTDGRFDMKYTR